MSNYGYGYENKNEYYIVKSNGIYVKSAIIVEKDYLEFTLNTFEINAKKFTKDELSKFLEVAKDVLKNVEVELHTDIKSHSVKCIKNIYEEKPSLKLFMDKLETVLHKQFHPNTKEDENINREL